MEPSNKGPFRPITRKVNTIILISLIIGIGSISFYFARSLLVTIDDSTRSNLQQQSDILYTSIENFMLPGEAPLAEEFFSDIETMNPEYQIRLFRRTGERAFSNNTTLNEVNKLLGEERFEAHERQTMDSPPLEEPHFSRASGAPPQESFFQTTEKDRVFFRVYKPLLNLPKCTVCHGSDHTVRGILDIRNNITPSIQKQRSSLAVSSALFGGMVVVLAFVLTRFLISSVIRPVKEIGSVCTSVTEGDFSSRVQFDKNDEIGVLGRTVNTMVQGLKERFELSKFVSSSTIKSLSEGSVGKSVPLTLLFTDIRGFTSYSDTHPAQTVVEYLNKILNDQTEIIHDCGGDIDKYVGDEIIAVFTGDDSELCAATAAVRIQRLLTGGEEYDGLRVGAGINHGDVISGMIGSQQRADYTVIGDNVNLASRLCSAAKPGEILISDSIAGAIKKESTLDGPYKLKVKGKNQYQRVYKLINVRKTGDQKE